MNITTKRNPIHFYYNMHGHILESVQHPKYLGVTIWTDLKWNTHIKQTAAKANKSLCFIRKNLKVQSQTIKERAYQTLIRPKLEYFCLFYSVWISIKEHIVSECTLEGFCSGVSGYVGG
jgi:hypothetical protein